MISQSCRCTNFQKTRDRLQRLIDQAKSTEARFAARSLLKQLETIHADFPGLTIKQLLTPRSETFD